MSRRLTFSFGPTAVAPELLLGDYNSQAGPESSIRRPADPGVDVEIREGDRPGRLRHGGRQDGAVPAGEISIVEGRVYEAEAYLDNDMVDMETPIRFHVRLIKEDDHITLDFPRAPTRTGVRSTAARHHHGKLPVCHPEHDGRSAGQ